MAPSNMLNTAARLSLGPESVEPLFNEQKERGKTKARTEPKPVPAIEEQTVDHSKQEAYRVRIVWKNVIFCSILHLKAIYGIYLIFTSAKIQTIVWGFLMYQAGILGITAGAHRLWSHGAYKAKWPLKLILIILNSSAFQNSVFEWVRDHRAHHKFSDTDGDPHNSQRGFFFSHVGWLLCRKHPDVMRKGSRIDIKDLEDDSLVQFQKRHFLKMVTLFCFIIPTVVPVYCWEETWKNAWYVAIVRYAFVLNIIWLVNSGAHRWGQRPYDKFIKATENAGLSFLSLGEGWHNYHHVFPWDYRTAELGKFQTNPTTAFIDFFAKIGWAYDLKTVPLSLIRKRANRTGTRKNNHEGEVWGWDDEDMSKKDKDHAIILLKKE
ncbi:unnamed protein product [Bemisia tabaci]|uniref:Fatty acid desaturase domain-containing protein n=1 Tax=Bemisia tabaci TaxID=7038 RepID=A0A9N9ZZP6_BEMTA|nr:unnamed protein product [Bemisia tabaci]